MTEIVEEFLMKFKITFTKTINVIYKRLKCRCFFFISVKKFARKDAKSLND